MVSSNTVDRNHIQGPLIRSRLLMDKVTPATITLYTTFNNCFQLMLSTISSIPNTVSNRPVDRIVPFFYTGATMSTWRVTWFARMVNVKSIITKGGMMPVRINRRSGIVRSLNTTFRSNVPSVKRRIQRRAIVSNVSVSVFRVPTQRGRVLYRRMYKARIPFVGRIHDIRRYRNR